MQIALSESFLDAMRRLDYAEAKRAAAFVVKLLAAEDLKSFREEAVHDANDRAARSLHVTRDVRAIARLCEGTLVLVWVDQHDHAYRWARTHCIECIACDEGLLVSVSPQNQPDEPRVRTCDVCSQRELARLLDDRGIAHSLS